MDFGAPIPIKRHTFHLIRLNKRNSSTKEQKQTDPTKWPPAAHRLIFNQLQKKEKKHICKLVIYMYSTKRKRPPKEKGRKQAASDLQRRISGNNTVRRRLVDLLGIRCNDYGSMLSGQYRLGSTWAVNSGGLRAGTREQGSDKAVAGASIFASAKT